MRPAESPDQERRLTPSLAIGPEQEQALTYGIFDDALLGVNQFRLFYPHLDFVYEIFVYPDGEPESEVCVGIGEMTTA